MRRLPITLLLVIVVAIFGVGYLLDAVFERYSSKTSDSYSQISAFGEGFADMLNNTTEPEVAISKWPTETAYSVSLVDKKNLPLPPSLQADFESGDPLILESEHGVSIHYILPNHDRVLSIQNDQLHEHSENGLSWLFTSVFYLGTLGVVLLWLKPLLNRLRLLRQSTKSFGAGNLESRVSTRGVSYIQDIEKDFNRMADRIQQLIEDNKLLTSAVSHDLRTPLARLRFGVDTLRDTTSLEGREQYMQRINTDLNEMESLVNSLLQYARLDNVMEGVQAQSVSLRNLINECISQFYDNDVLIDINDKQLDTNDSLIVNGRIEHLATMLNNLLQNAVKHANEHVLLEMRRDKEAIVIAISDDGPGIPVEEQELLMKPFQRGENASNSGYGLGLAVAERIAKHHKASISIDRCATLGGARLTITLLPA